MVVYRLIFEILAIFPILFWLVTVLERRSLRAARIVQSVLWICALVGSILSKETGSYGVMLCFLSGCLTVSLDVFEHVQKVFSRLGCMRYPAALIGAAMTALLRIVAGRNCDFDFVFTPVLLFFALVLLKSNVCQRSVNRLLTGAIGRYSTYIWLTHTFFGYYYFQRMTFAPYYSTLIFVWCLVLCVTTGFASEKFLNSLKRKIKE